MPGGYRSIVRSLDHSIDHMLAILQQKWLQVFLYNVSMQLHEMHIMLDPAMVSNPTDSISEIVVLETVLNLCSTRISFVSGLCLSYITQYITLHNLCSKGVPLRWCQQAFPCTAHAGDLLESIFKLLA